MDHRPAARQDRHDRDRRVMASVWRWKAPEQPPAADRARRLSGVVLRDVIIGLVIAGVLYAAGRPVIAGVAAVISVAVLIVRAVLPVPLSASVVSVAGRAAHWIGHALSATVLGAVYFSVFVPLRAWRDLTGHDTLRLKRRGPGGSFWIDRSTLPETSPDKPY